MALAVLRLPFQTRPLGGEIVLTHGLSLNLCLGEAGRGLFLGSYAGLQLRLLYRQLVLLRTGLRFQPRRFVQRLQIGLSLFAQHILVVAGVLVADDARIPHGRLIVSEGILQRIHALHGADHGGQILVGEHLQRILQHSLDRRGAKGLLGELGRAYLDEELDELVILADIPETENTVVYQLLIGAWGLGPVVSVADQIFELLLA